MEAIRTLWSDNGHYEVDSTQMLVAKLRHGGKSVYERIREKIGREFIALIVRIRRGGFHGRHNVGALGTP